MNKQITKSIWLHILASSVSNLYCNSYFESFVTFSKGTWYPSIPCKIKLGNKHLNIINNLHPSTYFYNSVFYKCVCIMIFVFFIKMFGIGSLHGFAISLENLEFALYCLQCFCHFLALLYTKYHKIIVHFLGYSILFEGLIHECE